MLYNWVIIIAVLVLVLGLITYLICQNQKDKNQATKHFDAEFPDPEFINEDEELNRQR